MQNQEDAYYDFASKISFLEFIQDEFRDANIPMHDFEEEISLLVKEKQWNINNLSDFISNNPRSFIIFEQIFQLKRFTNAQLIHFVFNIGNLNSLNVDATYEYMILNLKHDLDLREIYLKLFDLDLKYEEFIKKIEDFDKKYLIANFKLAVSSYIDKIITNFSILEKRIIMKEFTDFSIRFAHYLLNNLRLKEILASINVEKFLKNKRIPVDTKGLHGNYAKIRITKILEEKGYINIDNILNEHGVKILKHEISQQINVSILENKKIFCTERFVEGIIKPRDNKPKRFDLIIISQNKPKYLFEMNFYSTAGTKIGINEGEYIELNNYIKDKFSDFKFYWITDGNYWLKKDGKARFFNLLRYFDRIFNINLFAENINYFQ